MYAPGWTEQLLLACLWGCTVVFFDDVLELMPPPKPVILLYREIQKEVWARIYGLINDEALVQFSVQQSYERIWMKSKKRQSIIININIIWIIHIYNVFHIKKIQFIVLDEFVHSITFVHMWSIFVIREYKPILQNKRFSMLVCFLQLIISFSI